MAVMLAADSSYFWSPTPSGAAAVNTFPHRLHRSFSNSYTVAAMGACPWIRTNTPGSRCRYTLPSQAVSGHASPAFKDACGTLTFCAPPYAAAPWRPCPVTARFGFCETRSGPGFFSPVAMPARASTWAVFSVLAGHNNLKKQLIVDAVAQTKGNYTGAAKLLGLHPNYLHRLIRNLDIKGEVQGE